MNQSSSNLTISAKGYLSEEAKNKFYIRMAIVGIIFFFSQAIIPFIFSLAAMFSFHSLISQPQETRKSNMIYWQNNIWYIEEVSDSQNSKQRYKYNLNTISIDANAKPFIAKELTNWYSTILSDGNILWLIDQNEVAYYKNNTINIIPVEEFLGPISKAFFYNGYPAIIEERLGHLALRILKNNNWETTLFIPYPKSLSNASIECIEIASNGKSTYLLYSDDTYIYYNKLQAKTESNNEEFWQPLMGKKDCWVPAIINDELIIFYHDNKIIYGIKPLTNNKEPFISFKSDYPCYTVVATDKKNDFIFISDQNNQVIHLKNGKIISKISYASKPKQLIPFAFLLLFITFYPIMLITPVLMVCLTTKFMKNYRITHYIVNTEQVRYASPLNRMLANVVDKILTLLIILAILGLSVTLKIIEMPDSFISLYTIFLISIIMGVAASLLTFSYFEGKYGKTPGKLLLRIKVTDFSLKPCGFGRALLRNLLRFVDEIFFGMIGLFLIALTDHWQRVGDLAANTIVIKEK